VDPFLELQPVRFLLLRFPSRFLSDESGATAIEYGLIAAGISLLIIGAANNIGAKLNTTFTSIRTQLN
jgi:pilus assembly protein Flp/PilA